MKVQSVRVAIANWVLLVAGLVNIAIGTLHATAGNVALAGTCITAGLVLLLAGTIERFESLKGLGLEAKTRKLEDKLEQADDVLKKFRDLSETLFPVMVRLHAGAGRFDAAPSPAQSYEFARQVRRVLTAAGTPESTIQAALAPWAQTIAFDLTQYFLQDTVERIAEAKGLPAVAKLNELRAADVNGRSSWSVGRVAKWFREIESTDYDLDGADAAAFKAAVAKWATELEYLRDNTDLHDREAWFKQAAHERRH